MGPGPWGAAARARALAVHQWGVGTVVPRALVYHPKPNGHFEGDQVPRGNGGQRLWSAPPPQPHKRSRAQHANAWAGLPHALRSSVPHPRFLLKLERSLLC